VLAGSYVIGIGSTASGTDAVGICVSKCSLALSVTLGAIAVSGTGGSYPLVLTGSYVIGIGSTASGTDAVGVGVRGHCRLISGVGILTELTRIGGRALGGTGGSDNCGLVLVSASSITIRENAR
jgi:hypothetical protein